MTVIQSAELTPRENSEQGFHELSDVVQELAGHLWKNGQAWSDVLLASTEERVHVSLATPCRDSLMSQYDSELVRKSLEKLVSHVGLSAD